MEWCCARSRAPTPHLASPLKGGRDELGWGWAVIRESGFLPARVWREEGGGDGEGWVLGTARCVLGCQRRGGDGVVLCALAGAHPPPNLPPQRGEG